MYITTKFSCFPPAGPGIFGARTSKFESTPARNTASDAAAPPQLTQAPRDSAMAVMNKTLAMTKFMTSLSWLLQTTTLSTEDVGGKGEGEYDRATRESVAAPALLHCTPPIVWAQGPYLP